MHTHTHTHSPTPAVCSWVPALGSGVPLVGVSQAKQGKVFQVAGTACEKAGSRSVFRETGREELVWLREGPQRRVVQ